ncbi:MAG: hypothetical protein WBA17_06915, partial [Saprospiraceae bacterium]
MPAIFQNIYDKNNALRILHVATKISPVGGHTRVINNWVRHDSSNHHEILLTSQVADIPSFLSHVTIIRCEPENDLLSLAFDINAKIKIGGYDLIILHIHQNDASALTA